MHGCAQASSDAHNTHAKKVVIVTLCVGELQADEQLKMMCGPRVA